MLDGEPFVSYHVQLVDERTKCAGAVYRFNTGNAAARVAQSIHELCLKEIVEARWAQPCHGASLVGCLGGGVHIATPFHCDYSYNVSIGDNVIIGPDCQLLDSVRITIGRNTMIGARVTITTLRTPTDTKALKGSYGTEVAEAVHIGENVYIGDGCVIGAGVRFGNGAIVRSGSVVVHDIPPDHIASGNPANMHKAN
jgi:acetyltransferase-like isoleucine patch superfamily enzyme